MRKDLDSITHSFTKSEEYHQYNNRLEMFFNGREWIFLSAKFNKYNLVIKKDDVCLNLYEYSYCLRKNKDIRTFTHCKHDECKIIGTIKAIEKSLLNPNRYLSPLEFIYSYNNEEYFSEKVVQPNNIKIFITKEKIVIAYISILRLGSNQDDSTNVTILNYSKDFDMADLVLIASRNFNKRYGNK